MTARVLARLLWEELEYDSWGDVAPWWIRRVAETEHEDLDEANHDNVEAMRAVLERVAERITSILQDTRP